MSARESAVPDRPSRAAGVTDDDAGRHAATLAWAVLAIAGFGGFLALTWIVWANQPIFFDKPLMDLAKPYAGSRDLWNAISQAANFPLIAIGLGIVAILFFRHRRRDAILVFLVLASATAGSEGVKQLTHRDRPPGSDTVVPGIVYSYPSGHTLEVLTIFGIITILTWRSSAPRGVKVGVLVFTVVFVAAVCVARVAINAHFPSDVLAGLLGGLGVLGLFAILSRPGDQDASRA